MLLRSILIATDGSDHAIRALEHTQSLIHGRGCRVALIHVMSGETLHPVSMDDDDEPEDPVRRAHRIFQEACHILGADESDVEMVMSQGDPAKEIVKTARERHSDLIIMGSRGSSGWKGSPMGSVSQAVIAEAPCSVLVVKEQADHSHGAG